MGKRITLVSILRQNAKITIEDVKRKLELESNEEVYEKILSSLDNVMKRLDWNDTNQSHSYIQKIFSLFERIPSDVDIEQLKKSLVKIRDTYELKFARKIKKGENIPLRNITIHLLDSIDSTIIRLDVYSHPDQVSSQEEIAYKVMEYLIYDEKNYLYVFETLKNFPYLLNVRNKKGKYLIDNLVTQYIRTVKENKRHYDIIYFERIIKIFIESPHFNFDKNHRQELINKLNQSITELKTNEPKDEDKNRITFYLNEVIKDLHEIKITPTLEDIGYKYDINAFPDDVEGYTLFLQIRRKLSDLDNIIDGIDGEEEQFHLNSRSPRINEGTNLRLGSSQEHLQSYKKAQTSIFNKLYRTSTSNIITDYRNKRTITIDSNGTRTFDDACSLEKLPNGNFLLGIYVADVTKYIPRNNNLINNSYNLGESIYLPNKVITMLPEYVTSAMSLTANNSRFAIGYFFELTPQMECCKFETKQVIINPERNMDHDDVKNALDKADDIELYELLKNMLAISEHLHDKNIYSRQYSTIKQIKNKIYRSEELDDFNDSSIGSIIISEFMVLVNHYVADYFDKNDIPFIYRINLSNSNDKMVEALKDKIRENRSVEEILAYLNAYHKPSEYSTENIGHRDLNLSSYSHVTTPIRKFSSFTSEYLIVKYMIKKANLTDNHKIELEQYLSSLCNHLNEREQLNQQYKEEYYKTLIKNKT